MELIISQLRYFIASLLCGIIFMFGYDMLEVFRCKVKHGKIWIFTEDWLFWTVAAVLIFQMIFALNNGILRSFFVASFIGGMFAYRRVAKKHVVHGICAVLNVIFRPCVWILGKFSKMRKKNLK